MNSKKYESEIAQKILEKGKIHKENEIKDIWGFGEMIVLNIIKQKRIPEQECHYNPIILLELTVALIWVLPTLLYLPSTQRFPVNSYIIL